jgi:hypothetical protein
MGRMFKFLLLAKQPEVVFVTMPMLLILDFIIGMGGVVTQVGTLADG